MLEFQKHKKKIALLLVGMCVLIGCAKGEKKASAPAEEIILTIWETYNEAEHKVFLKIAEEFMRRNPGVRLHVKRVPWEGHEMKYMTSMVTHTAPDIARVDVAFVPRLVLSNSIIDLKQFGADKIIHEYVPAAINSNILKGGIWGIPDQTTGVALFYNKKHFMEAGITVPPRNWDEFIQVAKKLTRDLDRDGRTDRFGFAMHNSLWWTFPFFNTFGVKFLSEDGTKCLLDSDEGVAAFQLKVDLYQKHRVEVGAWQAGAIDPDTGFKNGMYSMIFSGPWNVQQFKDAGVDFGVALIPEGPRGTSTNVGGTNIVVFRECKHPEMAYEFLRFLTSPEIQAKWCNTLGQIPVNLNAYPLVEFKESPELEVFMKQMTTAIARPPVIEYSRLEEVVNAEMYACLSGRKTVYQALYDASRRVEREVLVER